MVNIGDKPYPYNLLVAHWDAERQMRRTNRDEELYIIQEQSEDFKFVVKETMDTGRTLYYIPLLPLHRLIASGSDKRSAELLLSVCAYLYHGAGIPHYRDEESYLHYHYEILYEELDNGWGDLDKPDIERNRSALRYASHFGDVMQRRLHNACHLENWGERIAACRPESEFQNDCLALAQEAFGLMTTYPDAHLFKNVVSNAPDVDENEDDEYYDDGFENIAVHEYVHFVAEINGGIYQSITEMVNCEFNEKQYTQEPAVITRFDQSFTGEPAKLDYERRIFKLINQLIEILDELP